MDINITSPKTVRELLSGHGIAPLKKYGQNFLIDGNIADKIAEAAVPSGGCALEIGPGLGALTQRLVKRAKAIAAYEIDAGLAAILKELFADTPNFFLFHNDFLKADIEKDTEPLFGNSEIHVAANLPYYITSPCIMRLVSSRLNIRSITVMVQKEVAERICAQPGSGDYGAISAAVAFFAEPKLLFSVSSTCFYPRPEVASAVMSLIMRPVISENAEEYLKTVRGLFAMRRKTVKSNLRQNFGLTMEEAENLLSEAGVEEDARAETLTVNDFITITKKISETQKKFN